MDNSNSASKILSQEESKGSSSIFKKRSIQTTVDSIFKKSEREDACQGIALFCK